MKKILIEYISYLSYLFKLKENKNLTENAIARKYKLNENSYIITKCNLSTRRKFNLPQDTYELKAILSLKARSLSELTDDFKIIIAIEVSEEQKNQIVVPYSAIYELENVINTKYFQRNIDNIYLIEKLSQEEITSLEERSFNYYQQSALKTKYAMEELEDGTISLVTIHSDNNNIKEYYLCDEYYPDELKDRIYYLTVSSKDKFKKENLPPRNQQYGKMRLYRK